jgi:protein tyrosine/serine phosphatase
MYRVLVLSISLLLVLSSPAAAEEAKSGIPRFAKISDGFYRGGQPNKSGFEYLKKQGVRTIINFTDGKDEEAIVKKLGMNYVHIPLSVSVTARIPESAIHQYFEVLNNPENYPIFIHCRRGADRTGAMVGFYRIAAQGWDGQKAYQEARNVGMRWWYVGLKDQLQSFAKSASSSLLQFGAAIPVQIPAKP